MTCLEFRRAVGAEPHSQAPEILQHAAQCVACARYRQQMQQMDSVIQRALAIDVDVPASRTAASAPRRRIMQWSLAASVMLAVALGVFWLGFPRDTLAQEVVQHVMHEADSLQPDRVVIGEAELAAVLAESDLQLRPGMADVTYATTCPFRNHHVAHLVVKTAAGPVTVLLLTYEESVKKSRYFNEGGFEGVVMPAPRGSLVVLGKDAPLDEVAQKVFAAVDYRVGW
ncbi:MAG TPA: DUF3379 family protein [Povalibacter sp.]|uniref:DUF3379 family protein n=1 Tax=Povalibacter sp. TaxID=1962978 RepID=UPI002CADE217|nr:DUF3379 family protein [Povalibacter sp.]HMN44157.1 DUF3379 family protein [Povalibacter sp.]